MRPTPSHLVKETIDPVCGMKADSSKAPIACDSRGRVYFFCSSQCRDEFQKHPERYAVKKKGWWSRYLTRVRKATGDKPMSCCH
jgi:YHS domain-containing protein